MYSRPVKDKLQEQEFPASGNKSQLIKSLIKTTEIIILMRTIFFSTQTMKKLKIQRQVAKMMKKVWLGDRWGFTRMCVIFGVCMFCTFKESLSVWAILVVMRNDNN